jgi:hypothetical protein
MRRWAIMKRLITPREPITRGNRNKYGTLTWQQDREIVEQEAKAYCRAKWRKAKEKLPQPEPLISERVHAEIEELIQGMPDCEPGCDDRGQDLTANAKPVPSTCWRQCQGSSALMEVIDIVA